MVSPPTDYWAELETVGLSTQENNGIKGGNGYWLAFLPFDEASFVDTHEACSF